jgi:hypothetical protein
MTRLLHYFLDFTAGTAQRQSLPRRRLGACSSIDLFNRTLLRSILPESFRAKGSRMPPLVPPLAPTPEAVHKFKVGRSVFLQSAAFNRDAARGAYEVTAQLPERDGQFEYRIKSRGEPHERVVKEGDLSLA